MKGGWVLVHKIRNKIHKYKNRVVFIYTVMSSKKKILIKKTLVEMSTLVKAFESTADHWKSIDNLSEGALLLLGLSTTFLLATNPVTFALFGTFTSGLGTVIAGMKNGASLRTKYSEAYAHATHLRNLYRDTLVQLAKNHLTAQDLDQILTNLNHELQLVSETPQAHMIPSIPSTSGIVIPEEPSVELT
jgi:hypothetical protein